MRREEKSTLMVVMKLKVKGKRPSGRPKLRWLDNEMFRESKILEDIDLFIN